MVQIKTEVRSVFNLEKGPRGQMRQLISSFLAILASILPSESDTTTSGCPYIVNRGKAGEHVCGVMSRSGPLCAEHQKRKPQKHYSHEEAEEKEKGNMKNQKKEKEKEKKEEEKGKGDEMDALIHQRVRRQVLTARVLRGLVHEALPSKLRLDQLLPINCAVHPLELTLYLLL